jgi:hypothetical protein
VNRDCLVDPGHTEQVATTKILLTDTATVGTGPDLVAQHLVEITSLGGKPVVDEGLRVGAAGQRDVRHVNLRKRFEEIALLLQVSGKVREFADLVLQFGNLLALIALKVLNNGGHLALHRIFNLDGDVEAL